MAYFSFTDQPTKIYFPGTLPFTAPEFDNGLQPSWKYVSLKKEMDVQLPHISRSSTQKGWNGTEQWTQHNLQSCKMFDQCFDKILKASKDAISDTKSIFDSKNKNTQDSEAISSKAGLIESSKALQDDVRKSHLGSEESRRKKLKNKAQRPGKKKMARHENAWGGPTYTELITKAILSAPEQRLTLSQIYDWLAENVEYFRERSNYNSSQGWKVRCVVIKILIDCEKHKFKF